MKTWYSISALFVSRHKGRPIGSETLWEERIFLVFSENSEDAERLGKTLALAAEHSYTVEGGDIVSWVFDRIERVYSIEAESLDCGSEIFSRFLRNSEVQSMLTPFED